MWGGATLRSINLKEINEKDKFIQAFRDYTFNKTDNSWIEGGNWDHENWGVYSLQNHGLIVLLQKTQF